MIAPRRHAPPGLRRLSSSGVWLLAGLGVFTFTDRVQAQPPSQPPSQAPPQPPSSADEARALELYEEGTRRMDAGDLAEACPRLEEAVRLVPDAGGAHLALGACFERSGRLASALEHYEQAVAFSDPFAERKQRAKTAAEALRPRVPRLVVSVAERAPARATVRVDGRDAARDVSIPLDAGSHVVELLDGGRVIARESAILTDGAVVRVSMAAAPPGQPPAPIEESHASGKTDAGPPWGALGVVALGVGGAGLILGAIAGGVATERDAASDDACDDRDFCSSDGFAARDEAFTWATVSTVGILVGGAFAAAGVTILIVDGAGADDAAARASAPRAAVRVGPKGLLVGGNF